MHKGEYKDKDLILYKASDSESRSTLGLSRLVDYSRSIIRRGKRGLPKKKMSEACSIISDVANCSYLEDSLSLCL